VYFLYDPGISPSEFAPLEQDQTFGPLRTMDNIIFLKPLTPLTSQPPRLPGALTPLNASRASITSLSVRQTASQLNHWNGISKDYVTKSRDVSDLSQQRHFLDQRSKNDLI
jgi:hypothetical protein